MRGDIFTPLHVVLSMHESAKVPAAVEARGDMSFRYRPASIDNSVKLRDEIVCERNMSAERTGQLV